MNPKWWEWNYLLNQLRFLWEKLMVQISPSKTFLNASLKKYYFTLIYSLRSKHLYEIAVFFHCFWYHVIKRTITALWRKKLWFYCSSGIYHLLFLFLFLFIYLFLFLFLKRLLNLCNLISSFLNWTIYSWNNMFMTSCEDLKVRKIF